MPSRCKRLSQKLYWFVQVEVRAVGACIFLRVSRPPTLEPIPSKTCYLLVTSKGSGEEMQLLNPCRAFYLAPCYCSVTALQVPQERNPNVSPLISAGMSRSLNASVGIFGCWEHQCHCICAHAVLVELEQGSG